jgi:hypothetical protein
MAEPISKMSTTWSCRRERTCSRFCGAVSGANAGMGLGDPTEWIARRRRGVAGRGAERGPEHDRDRPPPPPPPHGGPGPEGRGGPGGEDEGRRLMDWLREHNPELERRVDQGSAR